MKGLTHFISGAAFATFFPEVMDLVTRDQSFLVALGGAAGILPDTLDFKFARFMEKFDVEVQPDPLRTDAREIAQQVADVINRAHREQRAVSLKLHTVRLSSSFNRQYTVRFLKGPDPAVEVEIGPAVTTSKDPVAELAPVPEELRHARVPLDAEVHQDLEQDQVVDIFGGPDMEFVPMRDTAVHLRFIAWHRRWSHSLVLGVLLGLGVWLLALACGWDQAWVYGVVAGGAFDVHILEDQLGVMGSNLFWPFSRSRQVGLGWMHSGDAFPNFFFVWLSIILILWNLNRFSAHPVLGVWSYADRAGMRFETFFLAAFVLPMTLLYLLGRAFRRQGLNGRADEPRPVPARTESDMKLMQGEKDEDIES